MTIETEDDPAMVVGAGSDPPAGPTNDGRTGDDPAAFGDWVAPHLRALRAVAAREVGPDAAADVVQNTLLRAWRRRDTFRADRGTPRSWLMAILLDQARRQRTRARVLPHRPTEPLVTPHAAVNARLDVDAAIRTLPNRQRQVVVLYYLADLSVREVGAVLDIGEGSVKSYLSAGRDSLRRALEHS